MSERFVGRYEVDTIDLHGTDWRNHDFSGYDSVFHVAGIAHVDITDVSEEMKKRYYAVNCDLAVETAKRAKAGGIRQFIYMSSLLVYGDSGNRSIKEKVVIDRDTEPNPSNFYGDSKWQAEQELNKLADEVFRIAILRPPMVYGLGCRGNYNALVKIALGSPVFPDFPNKRSMCHIDNLAEFVHELVGSEKGGIFFPQDEEIVSTADIVRKIAENNGKRILISPFLNFAVYFAEKLPGRIGNMTRKAFGSLVCVAEN